MGARGAKVSQRHKAHETEGRFSCTSGRSRLRIEDSAQLGWKPRPLGYL